MPALHTSLQLLFHFRGIGLRLVFLSTMCPHEMSGEQLPIRLRRQLPRNVCGMRCCFRLPSSCCRRYHLTTASAFSAAFAAATDSAFALSIQPSAARAVNASHGRPSISRGHRIAERETQT